MRTMGCKEEPHICASIMNMMGLQQLNYTRLRKSADAIMHTLIGGTLSLVRTLGGPQFSRSSDAEAQAKRIEAGAGDTGEGGRKATPSSTLLAHDNNGRGERRHESETRPLSR